MNSIIFFLIFIPILGFVLLNVNFIFAPHQPYKEKKTPFECGYHSFLAQNRTQFTISFFIFGLLFLIFDLEIVLIYPFTVSSSYNDIYGLIIMMIFVLILVFGFIFELGKGALNIESKQYKDYEINIINSVIGQGGLSRREVKERQSHAADVIEGNVHENGFIDDKHEELMCDLIEKKEDENASFSELQERAKSLTEYINSKKEELGASYLSLRDRDDQVIEEARRTKIEEHTTNENTTQIIGKRKAEDSIEDTDKKVEENTSENSPENNKMNLDTGNPSEDTRNPSEDTGNPSENAEMELSSPLNLTSISIFKNLDILSYEYLKYLEFIKTLSYSLQIFWYLWIIFKFMNIDLMSHFNNGIFNIHALKYNLSYITIFRKLHTKVLKVTSSYFKSNNNVCLNMNLTNIKPGPSKFTHKK